MDVAIRQFEAVTDIQRCVDDLHVCNRVTNDKLLLYDNKTKFLMIGT